MREVNIDKMKINLTIILLISILLISCDKETYEGQVPLEQFSKELLPENDSIHYISSTGYSNTLELSSENNYFEYELWDTDEHGHGGGINYYYGDFEHLVKSYNSNRFRIRYHLYVESSFGFWDFLKINIESDLSNEKINIELATEKDYEGWPSFVFHDSIEFNDSTIYNVYTYDYQEKSYHFQLGKGIVGFEYDDELWILSQ